MSSQPSTRAYVLPETTLLAAIGCLDLLSTIYVVATNRAHEANPLFAYLLDVMGPTAFIAAKALFLGGPLLIAELARKRHEAFVKRALRLAIIAYVGLYLISFARNNIHFLMSE